ncbi:hypothetical protein, partial [Bacillus subtilis]|uniref:hypothetical protein n=1 Tax=Bacillus subtilis TaxID=1423 RepID=UPI001BDB9772
SLFNFPTETTPLALYLLFYQIKNCVSKEPYAFLTYTVNITLPIHLQQATALLHLQAVPNNKKAVQAH